MRTHNPWEVPSIWSLQEMEKRIQDGALHSQEQTPHPEVRE